MKLLCTPRCFNETSAGSKDAIWVSSNQIQKHSSNIFLIDFNTTGTWKIHISQWQLSFHYPGRPKKKHVKQSSERLSSSALGRPFYRPYLDHPRLPLPQSHWWCLRPARESTLQLSHPQHPDGSWWDEEKNHKSTVLPMGHIFLV